MINDTISRLDTLVASLKGNILLDIEDVKNANHEKLLERNEIKTLTIDEIANAKALLNEQLSQEFQNGVDITIYRKDVDKLEQNLRELYELNGKLASIVLPVKEMYREIIDDITQANGGNLVEVMA